MRRIINQSARSLFLILLLLIQFIVGCSKAGTSKSIAALQGGTLMDIPGGIGQVTQINQNVINEYFPVYSSISYENVSDLSIVKLSNDLISKNPLVQFFAIDRAKCSISYCLNGIDIIEFKDNANLKSPLAIAVSVNGDIFISDDSRQAVLKYKFNGSSIAYVAAILNNVIGLHLSTDDSGNLYVLDQLKQSLIVIDGNGLPVKMFLNNGNVTNAISSLNGVKFNGVKGLTLTPDDNILIVENFGRTLYKLNKKGIVIHQASILPYYNVEDVAVTNNVIYLVSKSANAILLLEPVTLKFLNYIVPQEHPEPWGKLQNMRKLRTYPDEGVMGVIDDNGTIGIFNEF